MGLSWERIKREWARMGYDVEGVVRHKYDREHGRGTYNERFASRAEQVPREEVLRLAPLGRNRFRPKGLCGKLNPAGSGRLPDGRK